jgi:Fe-S-cluster containining protein
VTDTPPSGPVCARCPRLLGRSCCEVKEGEHLAALTRADVERITAHTGLASRRFVTEEYLTEEEAAGYEARRPLYRGYFRRGPVRLTLLTRAGACVFHERGRGCGLPALVRPVACQLYPFERWPDGSWSVQMGRYGDLEAAREGGGACLAVEEAGSMEEVLGVFHTTREAVEMLGAQLAEDSRRHGRG